MNEIIGTINMPLRGLTGKDGLSAYEVACKNGFEGTVEDWLNTIATQEELENVEHKARRLVFADSSEEIINLCTNNTEVVVRSEEASVDIILPEECWIGWRCVINLTKVQELKHFDIGFGYPEEMFGQDAVWDTVEKGKTYMLVRVNENKSPNDFIIYEVDNRYLSAKEALKAIDNTHTHSNKTELDLIESGDVEKWNNKAGLDEEGVVPDEHLPITREHTLLSNALKGTASGAIIAVDDVSPVEHEVSCVVRSKNLIPFPYNGYISGSGITVSVDELGAVTLSGTANNGVSYRLSNKLTTLKPNTTYTLSGLTGVTESRKVQIAIRGMKGTSYVDSSIAQGGSIWTESQTSTFTTLAEDDERLDCYVAYIFVSAGTDLSIPITIHPMLNEGEQAVDWVPYVDIANVKPIVRVEADGDVREYIASEDGTVEGVTSLAPSMTLVTDTDNVVIECEYNRDINKAFEEMYNAIISLGGNI